MADFQTVDTVKTVGEGYVVFLTLKNLKTSTQKNTITHISRYRKKKEKSTSFAIPPTSVSHNLKTVEVRKTLKLKASSPIL